MLRPRETHYTFAPLEAGHTEELCVRIEIKQKSDNRLSLPLSDSVVSDSPITGEEVVTPVRTKSTPQLAGAWVARSHVIRPPLEPRTATKTPDSSYPSSATNSVTSLTGSVASSDGDIAKAMSRLTQSKLQGVWSKTGTTGAQVVKRQQEGGGKMFRIGGPDVGQRVPHTHNREMWRVGDDQRGLRHSTSSPALTGSIEPRSRQ